MTWELFLLLNGSCKFQANNIEKNALIQQKKALENAEWFGLIILNSSNAKNTLPVLTSQ